MRQWLWTKLKLLYYREVFLFRPSKTKSQEDQMEFENSQTLLLFVAMGYGFTVLVDPQVPPQMKKME